MAGWRTACAGLRREGRGHVAGGAALVVWLLSISPASGREPGRGPPSDSGPPVKTAAKSPAEVLCPSPASGPGATVPALPATADSAQTHPVEADPWHTNLVRERQVEVRLRTALRDLDEGRLVGALTGLQSILDRDDDVFVRLASEPVPCGAHALATRVLGSLSSRSLASYETLYGKEARQHLDAALAGPDPDLLARVVRRFYHTAAGFEAGNRLADYWADHGCDELAWGWWQRALCEPVHRERLQNGLRLRAAWCCQRLGRLAESGEILKQMSGAAVVTIAGRPLSTDNGGDKLPQQTGTSAADADTRVVGGRIDRNGAGSGSPPALSRPVWRGNLAGEHSRHIETLARAWEGYQLQSGLPVGTAQSPLLVGERLIYRDFEGLRAVDVRTGKGLWFYPCEASLSHEISPRQTIPSDSDPDPNKMMRCVVGNCLLGTLASDSRCVFAIDCIEADEPAPADATAAPRDGAAAPLRQTNVLVALELARSTAEIKPKWTAGGRSAGSGETRALAGHFFLGPPLPVEDRLFVISECNELLYLSCLRSTDGNLVWSQVLCSVPQPIGADHQRSNLVCSPAYSDGIVVCPTQAGVLVAVDSLSGRLLWAASHDDGEPQHRQQISAWPYGARRRIGHVGYVNVPVIHRARVVYLPAHSEHVHCLDLSTGQTRWRARRDDLESTTATEYVAAVTGDTVLVVGRRKCRGLFLESGAEKWMVRMASSTAGRGVRQGSSYHVPVDDGGLVSLDLDSGRRTAALTAPGATRLGNLVAGRDLIVSMGTCDIAVYPQAERILHGLESELPGGAAAPSKMLEAAELQLTLGHFDDAERVLEELLRQPGRSREAARAAELLRDLLVEKLSESKTPAARDQADAALGRLASLSGEPAQRGRYLWERCRLSNDRGDVAGALVAARELAAASCEAPLQARDDPSRKAATHVLAAGFINRLLGDDVAAVRAFEDQIAGDLAAAFAAKDAEALRRLLTASGDGATADMARLQLAQLLIEQGRFQQAETVLLACRESRRAATAGQATRLLAELWNQRGLHHDAALLLAEIGTRFADAQVAPPQRGAEWLSAFPRDDPAFEAYRRLAPPVWTDGGVRIVENRIPNEALQAAYNGNGVQYLPTPRRSPFDLFDKGRGSSGEFSVVDRHTGKEYPETIHVPGRFFYPVGTQSGYLQHSHVGHFFPLGGSGALHGVSLLERKLSWTTVPPELAGAKEIVRVGPAGPGFCSFQYRHHLFVVDPVDGGVLWHRDDLEAAAGLMNEAFLGIIGDEHVLVVFAGNGANYTVYDTASGAELRRGKLDIQTTRLRPRAMGRRLFHCTATTDNRRLRVWDPVSDRFLWDEPADQIVEASVLEGVPPGTKVFSFVRDTDEVAFVTMSGRIRVVDLVSGQNRLDVAIDPEQLDNLSFLRAFRDRERYYFNLQRSWPPGKSPALPGYLVSDASLPRVDIQGELCAVDANTGRSLWQRTVGNRSLLQMPDLPLPVLVSLCRISKQDQSSLSVEVLDVRTGETLASREDILSDRL
ncbi:MAG: PQQ-binding-like beta-propeller repeat protein, partial [Deltaproteobacteria bacterium]